MTTKKICCFLILLLANVAFSQTARVQVIHNSADSAAEVVDVYLNGNILLNDFAFRTATPFVDAPAGTPLTIVVAPGNSTSAADGIYTLTTTLEEDEKYILIANGIVSESGYAPAEPFQLSVFSGAREEASIATSTDVLVNHGSTDAPTVDAVETSVPAGTVVNNISYPDFTEDYLELVNANYVLDVTDETGQTVVASYLVPLAALNLQGEAITVVASGFLNPANNSNGPAFGLWVATAEGGDLIELPLADQTAYVQVIHNSADLAAATVDVYLNETLLVNDFQFRTATPFVFAPAGVEITLSVAPANSDDVSDSIYSTDVTLEANENYIVVANGIVSESGYAPAQPFNLYVYPMARFAANENTNTDVLVFHGATDAPTVDVQAAGAGTIVDDLEYGTFDGYLELPTADYTLSVATANGETVVASYSAPLETLGLQNAVVTVLASGFLTPENNSNGPAFGLWASLATGGALIELPSTLSTDGFSSFDFAIYPNPSKDFVTISGNELNADMSHNVFDASGRNVISGKGNTVNVSGLSHGIYVLQVNNNGNISSKKLVVE